MRDRERRKDGWGVVLDDLREDSLKNSSDESELPQQRARQRKLKNLMDAKILDQFGAWSQGAVAESHENHPRRGCKSRKVHSDQACGEELEMRNTRKREGPLTLPDEFSVKRSFAANRCATAGY